MQTLEQIRARNALAFASKGAVAGDKGGEVIKKISPLIVNHGLLATAAYSFGEKEGWQKVFDAIAVHLADPNIAILAPTSTTRESMLAELASVRATSATLKLATSETMAWLTYARRFVKKQENPGTR